MNEFRSTVQTSGSATDTPTSGYNHFALLRRRCRLHWLCSRIWKLARRVPILSWLGIRCRRCRRYRSIWTRWLWKWGDVTSISSKVTRWSCDDVRPGCRRHSGFPFFLTIRYLHGSSGRKIGKFMSTMAFVVIPLQSLFNFLGASFEDVLIHKRRLVLRTCDRNTVLKRRLNSNSAGLYPFSSGVVLYASKASYGSEERCTHFTVWTAQSAMPSAWG